MPDPIISDTALMRAAGEGDMQAFGLIVRRHQAAAWRIAYRFTGNTHEAEDLVQDALIRVLEAAPRYKPTAPFSAYLYRILTRLCIDRSRKARAISTIVLPDIPAPATIQLNFILTPGYRFFKY